MSRSDALARRRSRASLPAGPGVGAVLGVDPSPILLARMHALLRARQRASELDHELLVRSPSAAARGCSSLAAQTEPLSPAVSPAHERDRGWTGPCMTAEVDGGNQCRRAASGSGDTGGEQAEVVGQSAVGEVGDACAKDGDRLGR